MIKQYFPFLLLINFSIQFCCFLCRDDSEIIIHADDGVVTVAYLRLKSVHLEEKEQAYSFDFNDLVLNQFGTLHVRDGQESVNNINLKVVSVIQR